MKDNIENKSFQFLALSPYTEEVIVAPTESAVRGQSFIEWGENNMYANYVNSLYQDVPTLQSIVNGLVDYVAGDEVISHIPTIGNNSLTKLVKNMALEYGIYGGFALNVQRNTFGKPVSVELLDMRKIRTDKKHTTFFYSDDFCEKSYGRCKYLTYPAFAHINEGNGNSIYYYSNSHFKVYPTPLYSSAVKSCEIEKSINDFHLNSINNGLFAGFIVNFNNGQPSDEQKVEIERNFEEKFSGKDNAGRILLSFNDTKDNAVTAEKLDVEDFGEKYQSLATRSRQEIFTAFRATPVLFGITTDNSGFAKEQFGDAFKLFNKTVIVPIQNVIIDTINEIFGENSIEIKPFKIEFNDENSTID